MIQLTLVLSILNTHFDHHFLATNQISSDKFINPKFILYDMAIAQQPERSRVSVSVNELRRLEPVEAVSPPKQKAAEREISISIKPWKLVKLFLMLVLFTSIFYLGRLSVDPSMMGGSASGVVAKAPTAAVVQDQPAVVDKAAPAESAKQPAENTATGAVVNTQGPAVTDSGVIITKYAKVALATTDVTLDWRETWGKIMQLAFTIKNNEDGTIKPAYFIMNVEGYNDFDKKIDLPSAAQTVKAGEKLEAKVNVPGGFAYSPVTAGDLNSVKVSVTMYDSKDTVITAYEREFNLNGGAK